MQGSSEQVRQILVDIGIENAALRGDARLRADLGLDSTETAQLEIELAERIGVRPNLWDQHDYTVQELTDIADETAIIEGPARA